MRQKMIWMQRLSFIGLFILLIVAALLLASSKKKDPDSPKNKDGSIVSVTKSIQ